jgi:hypothetical protein
MVRRSARHRKQVVAVGAVAGLAATIALLTFGAEGAEIATVVAVYIAWLGVLVAWFALDSQRHPGPDPPGLAPGARDPRAPLSSAVKRRVIAIAVVVVILFAGLLSGISAPPTGSRILLVAGGVTLLQQDRWLNYQRVLVFQSSDGQYGYLARPDARWWLPWQSINPVRSNYPRTILRISNPPPV